MGLNINLTKCLFDIEKKIKELKKSTNQGAFKFKGI